MRKKLLPAIMAAGLILALTACSDRQSGVQATTEINTIELKATESAAETKEQTAAEPSGEEQTESKALSAEPMFEQFLAGEIKANISADAVNDLSYTCVTFEFKDDGFYVRSTFNGAESLSLNEITELVKNSPESDASGAQVFYAVMPTLFGKNTLIVKYQGLGIYSPGDDSCAYFVFTCSEKGVNLIYSCDSWARSNVTVYDGAVFGGYGSGGAGDGIEWCGCVNGEGAYYELYSLETLYDDWVAMYDMETFGFDTEWSRGCILYLLETKKGSCFSYETEADNNIDKDKFAVLLQHLQDRGIEPVADVRQVIESECSSMGIKPDQLTVFEDWKELN